MGVSPEKVCWCEYWDIWVPSHEVLLAVRWCAIFFGDNRSRSVLAAAQMGCHDLIGRQRIRWMLCLLSSAWQTENRAKYAENMLWIFLNLFLFPINPWFIFNEIPSVWIFRTGLGKGMTWLQLLPCWSGGACDIWSAGTLTVPWQAEAVQFKASAVTAEHSFCLCSDPLLWEVAQAQGSCSCRSAASALAAKKEVLSFGNHPYFEEASLDTAESAPAKRQGLENFAFDHIQSLQQQFVPLTAHQDCRTQTLPHVF